MNLVKSVEVAAHAAVKLDADAWSTPWHRELTHREAAKANMEEAAFHSAHMVPGLNIATGIVHSTRLGERNLGLTPFLSALGGLVGFCDPTGTVMAANAAYNGAAALLNLSQAGVHTLLAVMEESRAETDG